MAGIIVRFGNVVNTQVEKGRSHRALFLLKGAYAAFGFYQKHLPNKALVPSRQYMTNLSMSYIRKPLSHPERTAIVNFFMPCQLLLAADINSQVAEGMSCYITGARAQRGFIEQAAGAGAPETLCAYHRILTGMALSDTLPRPRFIANTTMICDANMLTFRLLAQHYGVPHFVIDVPNGFGSEELAYVAGQLRSFSAFIEEVMGERADPERLREAIVLSNKSMDAYRRYYRLLANAVIPNDQTTEMYTVLATHQILGSPEGLRFFEMLLHDVEAAPKMTVLPPERRPRRILWAHVIPFYQKPVREFFAPREDGTLENQLLTCDMTFDALNLMDPDDPYGSMAKRLLTNSFNGPVEHRCGRLIEMAHKLKADGIVYFCHWGCRNTAGGAGVVSELAEEAGMPLLVLDGDGCDPQNTSDGQVSTRLQAFAELIDACRKDVK